MNYDVLFLLIEKIRQTAIGDPVYVVEKQAFEYQEQTAKVVAVLKLVRAAHGVTAMKVLCGTGLFIDFGAIIRCVNDAEAEIYFLLEKFPETSDNVGRFVKTFFEATIDTNLTNENPRIPSNKIRSAMVRYLKGHHDNELTDLMTRIYKTFCGYVHADYAHIMEVYNGGTRTFNLTGVPSAQQRQMRIAHVEQATLSVLHAAAFIVHALDLTDLRGDIRSLLYDE